jgi:D-threo-aldose 1-dehydrogenase
MTTHRAFGRTGIKMPRVVFGATVLGNLFVAMSDQQKRELISQWLNVGPHPIAIDSAGKYGAGLSLEVIGRELAALDVDPADVIISNKLAWRSVPLTTPEPTFEPGVWMDLKHDAVQDISYEGILRCHQDGCEKLGAYRPQLITVHDPDEYLAAASSPADRQKRLADIGGAFQAMSELRDAGQVAGIGVGAKDWRIIQELSELFEFDWVMMANSFTVMNHPAELIELVNSLAQRNVAIVNSAVTHGGFLVGGSFLDYRPLDAADPDDAKRLRWRDEFTQVCRQYDASPYQVAVVFGGSHPAFHSIALSTSSPARVKSMVQAASATIPTELWDALREQKLIAPDYPHV